MVKALLLSTYELGRQPFGLASPAAWLRAAGAVVTCLDVSLQSFDEDAVRAAELIAFYLPMHTATRIAARTLERVRRLNPRAHLCAYGLYAPLNADWLRESGVATILGGEFESGLAQLARELSSPRQASQNGLISLQRQQFLVPDRRGLPALGNYARLALPDGRRKVVGYTEASRGCKHLCRHCPIVPVYQGRFRIVQREIVLEDIRRQVAAGAQHITFGDPDFFNGVGHALAIVRELHREHPALTYDVTIKVEHLLKHARHLPALRDTGCAFVTSAVESVDDHVLTLLEKGHTRADFVRVARMFQDVDLVLSPTFVAFTPWITLQGYADLLQTICDLGLVDHVAPVQLCIRLLITGGSRLLQLPEVGRLIGEFDPAALCYRWRHPDPRVDTLQHDIEALVRKGGADGCDRRSIFEQAWRLLRGAMDANAPTMPLLPARAAIPYLTEPWYC